MLTLNILFHRFIRKSIMNGSQFSLTESSMSTLKSSIICLLDYCNVFNFFFYIFSVLTFERHRLSQSPSVVSSDEEDLSEDSKLTLFGQVDVDNFPMNIDLNVNDLFINKEVMVDAFGVLAVRNNFEVRVSRSSNSRYNLICKVSNCPWKMNATVCRESKLWVIRTFVKTHNCYSHVSSATTDNVHPISLAKWLSKISCVIKLIPLNLRVLLILCTLV